MLLHEIMKQTRLTKKAIEYYIEQGLINPRIQENGYRDFSPGQAEQLKKISALRRLGLNMNQIRDVLADPSGCTLQRLSVQRELMIQKEQKKRELLEQLGFGRDYCEITEALDALEQNMCIAERLCDAFPGFYGKYICLHFARFLTSPISTEEQKEAYKELIGFLDSVPEVPFPEELRKWLEEIDAQFSSERLLSITEGMEQAVAAPEAFLSENREAIDSYLSYMQSKEYKDSPASRIRELLLSFNRTSGYYDIFLPAMKRLSPAYEKYCLQLEAADQFFLKQYPDYGKEGTQ